MKSTFAWLDYSDSEREDVLRVIKHLQAPEARDELGIGVIRDRISDILFPGTSTIQTRLKYFFFVPWIFLQLDEAIEQKIIDSQDAQHFLRQQEEKLLITLLRGEDKTGVVGRVSGTTVKTMPSEIYWGGLGMWEIRNFVGSRADYLSDIAELIRREKMKGHPDEEYQNLFIPRWDANIPKPPAKFPTVASLAITPDEAKYLRELLQVKLPRSLLTFLAQLNIPIPTEIQFPWDLPKLINFADVPDYIRTDLKHAQNFSEAMDGATLSYNLMLAQMRGDEKLIEDYKGMLNRWCNLIENRWQ